MWTRRFKVCWLQLQVEHGRHFHLSLPISFFALVELLDCVVDLLDIACSFVPKSVTRNTPALSVHAARELLLSVEDLLDSLTGTEPYDLVEVETGGVRVSVKFR